MPRSGTWSMEHGLAVPPFDILAATGTDRRVVQSLFDTLEEQYSQQCIALLSSSKKAHLSAYAFQIS